MCSNIKTSFNLALNIRIIMKINLKTLLLLLVLITATLKEQFNSISIIILTVFAIYETTKNKSFNVGILKKLSPFLIYYTLIVISAFYSENSNQSFKMIVRLLPFLLFPFVFSILKITRKELETIFKGYILWILGICLYSHFVVSKKLISNQDQLYNIFNNNYSYLSLTQDTIGLHSTYYAYAVLIAIIFSIYLFFKNISKKYKAALFVIFLYFSFFIFHISARLPIAVMFLIYNIVIVYYFIKTKKIKQGAFLLLFLYISSGIVLYNVRVTRYRFQQVFGFTYYDGSTHQDGKYKLRQWQASLAANNNILLGNGIGDANESIYNSYPNFDLEKYKERKYNAHNQFIQTFVGLGLIGVISLLIIFIFFCLFFINKKSLIGLIFTLSSFILFLTESFLERQAGIVFFSFVICLIFTALSINNEAIFYKNYKKGKPSL